MLCFRIGQSAEPFGTDVIVALAEEEMLAVAAVMKIGEVEEQTHVGVSRSVLVRHRHRVGLRQALTPGTIDTRTLPCGYPQRQIYKNNIRQGARRCRREPAFHRRDQAP